MDFQSEVRFRSADGGRARTEVIRVNHPAVVRGVRYFQFGFGWAPVVEIGAAKAQAVREDPIPFGQDTAPEGVSQLAMPWNGFVKLPAADAGRHRRRARRSGPTGARSRRRADGRAGADGGRSSIR